MIDPVLVTRKISLIAGDLRAVEALARLSLEEYLRDPINEVAVERYLERLIGRMIDINYHVVTEMGHPPPKDYFESFLQMGRLSALPAEFAREIASLAGLRNRLVHEYNDLDAAKVYEALQKALQDIPRFLRYVDDFVDRQPRE